MLVHRPDLELRRITPSNKDELLFDELVWVDRAQAEHDAFTAVLEDAGAEVLFLHDLLADVLADEDRARELVTCAAGTASPVRGHASMRLPVPGRPPASTTINKSRLPASGRTDDR